MTSKIIILMKKEAVLFLFIILISGCAKSDSNFIEIEENIQVDNIEAPVIEEIIEETTTTLPVKEEIQLIYPVLTYEGAYNGPLYGTSEQVGSASMDSYFENLDRNGINFFIGMFGISGEPSVNTLTSDQGLGEVIDAAKKHPKRIIPFFNPGIGGEEVEKYLGGQLTGMYRNTLAASKNILGENFIRGFGEVETQEWAVRHNDAKVIELIEMAKANNINFMFHPVASKIDDVEKIIEAYPETTFLIHMYREDVEKSRAKLIQLLQEHDNLYFSIDAAHILFVNGNDIIYTYDSSNKQSAISKFVSTYDRKEKSTIDEAIKDYKPLVDATPDKIMWGTEIGPEYAFSPEVFDRAVKISRFVIAGLDLEDQEAVGYKNALRVFGEGVTFDSAIEIKDTSSWSDCSENQMDACDDSCNIPDSDFLTAEQESCFSNCLKEFKCKEVVEMDVG